MICIYDTPQMIRVQGHAHDGDGPVTDEEKEACAGVTALTHMLVGSIVRLTQDDPELHFRKGYFELKKDGLSDKAKLLVQAYETGLEMIMSAYDEYIVSCH